MLSYESHSLRVLLVDDHELTRLTLKLAFSGQENVQVVGLASNGKEAIDMVKDHQPDVVVLDLHMPVMDGWSASSHIKSMSPHTQILAFSSVEDQHLQQAKSTSIFDEVCTKDAPTTKLISLVSQLGKRVQSNSYQCL